MISIVTLYILGELHFSLLLLLMITLVLFTLYLGIKNFTIGIVFALFSISLLSVVAIGFIVIALIGLCIVDMLDYTVVLLLASTILTVFTVYLGMKI